VRRFYTCCLAVLLAGCGEPLYLMFEQHLQTPDGERLVGAGCESIGDSASGSAGAAPDVGGPSFSIEHEGHDDEGVRVLVRGSGGRVLAVRAYNEDFLRSDEVDEFDIELDPQNTLRLRYWGGTHCEDPSEFGSE
jgi:hypothetical protein